MRDVCGFVCLCIVGSEMRAGRARAHIRRGNSVARLVAYNIVRNKRETCYTKVLYAHLTSLNSRRERKGAIKKGLWVWRHSDARAPLECARTQPCELPRGSLMVMSVAQDPSTDTLPLALGRAPARAPHTGSLCNTVLMQNDDDEWLNGAHAARGGNGTHHFVISTHRRLTHPSGLFCTF